jgi:hypothetical protein
MSHKGSYRVCLKATSNPNDVAAALVPGGDQDLNGRLPPPAAASCDADSEPERSIAQAVNKATSCHGTARDVRFKDGGWSMLNFHGMVPCTSP